MMPIPIVGRPQSTIFQCVDDQHLFATGVAANERSSVISVAD